VNLWLLSPPANAALTVARLALMFVASSHALLAFAPRVSGWPGRAAVLVAFRLALAVAMHRGCTHGHSDAEDLDELRDKLFAPADWPAGLR